MTRLVICLGLAGALVLSGLRGADTPAQPAREHVSPGLELPAPQKCFLPGYVKITAKVDVKEPKHITWKVESQWDNPKGEAAFKWEPLDPKTMLVGIPNVRGVIRLSVAAYTGGEVQMAFTTIDVEPEGLSPAPPLPPVLPTNPPPGGTSATPTKGGKAAFAIFVVDEATGDPNVTALATSIGTRNAIKALGLTPVALDVNKARVKAEGLEPVVQGAGGVPALILKSAEGDVLLAMRCPVTREAVLEQVRRFAGQ